MDLEEQQKTSEKKSKKWYFFMYPAIKLFFVTVYVATMLAILYVIILMVPASSGSKQEIDSFYTVPGKRTLQNLQNHFYRNQIQKDRQPCPLEDQRQDLYCPMVSPNSKYI